MSGSVLRRWDTGTAGAESKTVKAYSHATFNEGVPWTIVSVDTQKLPPPGIPQALSFLADFMRAMGFASTHFPPHGIKATSNARAAGARGNTEAVFATTGRTLGFNSANELRTVDMLALVDAVAMAWRRGPLVFFWGTHHTRAAVALLPGVERPAHKPNVPLRIQVTKEATFSKLMAAISAHSKGPFVFRRAHPVASLASTLPLVEEMIKTDVLLWSFLPSDVGRGAALAAALVKWAAENRP